MTNIEDTSSRFTAIIRWGTSNDNTDNSDTLPEAFSKAKLAFDRGDQEEASRLLSPYIRCQFIASNLFADTSELLGVEEDEEVDAEAVFITAVNFSEGCIPSVKASAKFQFRTERELDEAEVTAWEEENESLDNAISFSWAIDNLDDSLDQTISEHEGLSFHVDTASH
jgi:hypothetical protein